MNPQLYRKSSHHLLAFVKEVLDLFLNLREIVCFLKSVFAVLIPVFLVLPFLEKESVFV